MKITKIRVTALDAYENCPRCYFYSVTGVRQSPNENLRLGTLTHKAIEEYHRFSKKVFNPEIAIMVKPYIEMYKPEYKEIEWKFELPNFLNSEITLTGTLDFIGLDEYIYEHKTSKARWTQKQADEHKQITAYSFAYRQIFKKAERGLRFNILVKNKTPLLQTIDTFRTMEDYKEWTEWVLQIFDNIKNDKFAPNYGARYHNFSTCPGVLRK